MIVNTAYATTLAATGGTAPYTWTVSSGTLPSWASLTASAGVITGTPTAAGTTSFTVNVTDSASDSATQALSITVKAAAPPPTPAAPDYAGVTLDRSPRHRPDRLHPDRRPGPAAPGRRCWLPLRASHRPQLLNAALVRTR